MSDLFSPRPKKYIPRSQLNSENLMFSHQNLNMNGLTNKYCTKCNHQYPIDFCGICTNKINCIDADHTKIIKECSDDDNTKYDSEELTLSENNELNNNEPDNSDLKKIKKIKKIVCGSTSFIVKENKVFPILKIDRKNGSQIDIFKDITKQC